MNGMKKNVMKMLMVTLLSSMTITGALSAEGDAPAGSAEDTQNFTGNTATTEVSMTIDSSLSEADQLNATVPLTVTLYGLGKSGTVLTPDSNAYKITNNSMSDIYVKNIEVTGANGWTLVPNELSATEAKKIAFSLQKGGESASNFITGTFAPSGWTIPGHAAGVTANALGLNITAKIGADQNADINGTKILEVKYTIGYEDNTQGT